MFRNKEYLSYFGYPQRNVDNKPKEDYLEKIPLLDLEKFDPSMTITELCDSREFLQFLRNAGLEEGQVRGASALLRKVASWKDGDNWVEITVDHLRSLTADDLLMMKDEGKFSHGPGPSIKGLKLIRRLFGPVTQE